MKTIEYDCECDSCKGTGLYQGFAEKDGAAVVCHTCDGKGWFHEKITYKETDKNRKGRKGIKRVFITNPGIGIGEGPVDGKKLKLEDFGGLSYADWAAGKEFGEGTEMRAYTCPAWWYQSADNDKKPEWKECQFCGCFSDCKHYHDKAKCWERFDKENK
jgi:hypothetical protein